MPINPENLAQEITNPLQILLANFITALPGVIVAIVIFILTLYFAATFSRLARRAMQRRKTNLPVTNLIAKVTYWSVFVLGLIVALQQVGFNLTAFLTGLGIVGFTIGFALQDVSKNFVAGLLLLISQPFRVGDAIEVAGYAGNVMEIDLRATEMHTWDGRIVLIPNGDVLTNAITNFSRAARRRVDLPVGVAYGSNLERVRLTALGALSSVTGVLSDPAPWVQFDSFGDSAINLTVFFWIDTSQIGMFIARDQALVAVNEAFHRAAIEIPFPVRTVLTSPPANSHSEEPA